MRLKLRTSLISLSIICLSLTACSKPTLKPVERCVISFEFLKCRCHLYDFEGPPGERRVSESYDEPLAYCHNGVVFRTEPGGAWEQIVNWLDEWYLYWQDQSE